jgi:hypothetical protein
MPHTRVGFAALLAFTASMTVIVSTQAPAGANRQDNGSGDETHHNDRVFYLAGTAMHDRDLENPKNQVIRLRSAFDPMQPEAAQFGAVARVFQRGHRATKVWDLDNQLEAKHRFEAPHSCGIGSPRMTLAIDTDGDGESDGNAFGYVGTPPGFVSCPPEVWLYEDFTGPDSIIGLAGFLFISANPPGVPGRPSPAPNEELEWDLTQFGGPFYNTWSQVELFFAAHPEHRVCAARYVDDFGAPPGSGHADIITLGDATWNGWDDTKGRRDVFAGDPCRFRDDGNDRGDDDDERKGD